MLTTLTAQVIGMIVFAVIALIVAYFLVRLDNAISRPVDETEAALDSASAADTDEATVHVHHRQSGARSRKHGR